jgi:HNH endonuclease
MSNTGWLTPEEVGATVRLVSHSWLQNPPGSLPDDDVFLSSLIGIDIEKWNSIKKYSMCLFSLSPEGRWETAIAKLLRLNRNSGLGDDWAEIRRLILARDFHTCGYCGEEADAVDHVIPRSKGGLNEWDNLLSACRRCNSKKNNLSLGDCGMVIRFMSGRAV